jgi:hypothetical protein
MLGWDQYGFDKKCQTRYTELVFLQLVGSAGYVVHSGAFGARNVDALFFMLRWARCGLHKWRARTRYGGLCFYSRWDLWVALCILVRPWCEMSMHYFSCLGGPSEVSI